MFYSLIGITVLVQLLGHDCCSFQREIVIRGKKIWNDEANRCPNQPGCEAEETTTNRTEATTTTTIYELTSTTPTSTTSSDNATTTTTPTDNNETTTTDTTTSDDGGAAPRMGDLVDEESLDFSEEFSKLPDDEEDVGPDKDEFYDDYQQEQDFDRTLGIRQIF